MVILLLGLESGKACIVVLLLEAFDYIDYAMVIKWVKLKNLEHIGIG